MEWIKSSFCSTEQLTDQCVEAIRVDEYVYLKDPRGSVVNYTPDEFRVFLDGVKAGEFDHLI